MSRTPWGCAPATHPDLAVMFNLREGLIFHSLSTADPDVLRGATAVAVAGGDVAAWAVRCLQVGARLTAGTSGDAA